jgi:uncharacterized protein (TIGR00730 family)
MTTLRSVCVFCGSSMGTKPLYAEAAASLGRLLAERGLGLVYGGGDIGLMGALANAAVAAGGDVTGVIPEALKSLEGVGHIDPVQLHVVGSMHERKALMAQLSDAFIALPGGIGTMEELFEIWTWGQLGLHAKPLGFLDVGGFYGHLHDFLDHMVAEGFLKARHRAMVAVESDPAALLARLEGYVAPEVVKVIDRDTA